jgi:hypothetical protein
VTEVPPDYVAQARHNTMLERFPRPNVKYTASAVSWPCVGQRWSASMHAVRHDFESMRGTDVQALKVSDFASHSSDRAVRDAKLL